MSNFRQMTVSELVNKAMDLAQATFEAREQAVTKDEPGIPDSLRITRQQEYAAQLQPIPDTSLPDIWRYTRKPSSQGVPYLHYGLHRGLPLDCTEKDYIAWIEHIKKVTQRIIPEAMDTEDQLKMAREYAECYIADQCRAAIRSRSQAGLQVFCDTAVVGDKDLLTVSFYSNHGRDEPLLRVPTEPEGWDKAFDIAREVLGLPCDAEPMWYFDDAVHGPKANNYKPFDDFAFVRSLKAEPESESPPESPTTPKATLVQL